MLNYQTVSAFASPIIAGEVSDVFSKLRSHQNTIEYKKIFFPGNANSFGSIDQQILKKFPEEESYLLSIFNKIKDGELGYANTKFKISRSWITKTPPGGYSKSHNHGNSFMSGVLYYDFYDENTSPIVFSNENFPSNTFSLVPDVDTQFNNQMIELYPSTNVLVLFPSYLYHKIGFNKSDKFRYSLAFNIVPVGQIGSDDSLLELS